MGDRSKRLHLDGGLSGGAPHVTAALQAIFHTPILEYIVGDTDHRNDCNALLKCLPCALFRLIESIKSTGVGNAAPFVFLWNYVSRNMIEDMQQDAFEVLFTFLCKLRLSYVERIPEWTDEDFHSTIVGTCFELRTVRTVKCDLCGGGTVTSKSMSLDLASEISEESVNGFFSGKHQMCPVCQRYSSPSTKCEVQLPPYLIVHSTVPCSESFRFPFAMTVQSRKLKFLGCIAQNGDRVMFISLCPDGRVRMFQNEKIVYIALGTLASSSTTFADCLLTAIYEIPKDSFAEKTKPSASKSQPLKLKVTGMPNLDCDLYSNLPEPPKTRTVGTQTSQAVMVDSSSQTEKKKFEPIISYTKCKNNEKFQLFTGLSKEDFEALHDFLGGEDCIRYLKLFYALSEQTSIRQSRLSSRDRLFMFLLRLRRGLPLEELSFIFNVSDTYAGEICYAMTRLIYETFKTLEDRLFVSAAEQAKTMPYVMKRFKNLRVILDGVSFFIETPSNFEMQGNTYSEYKKDNVLVFIVGISCKGGTIFCSKGFEGNISEKSAIMLSPEFLARLDPGDSVMVDRGFEITAELLKLGVHVIKPPPRGDGLNAEDELLTKAVASARIYVEHAMADIKDNRLLRGTIPLTLYPVLPQLVYIAAFMRNFSTRQIENRQVKVAEGSEGN